MIYIHLLFLKLIHMYLNSLSKYSKNRIRIFLDVWEATKYKFYEGRVIVSPPTPATIQPLVPRTMSQ